MDAKRIMNGTWGEIWLDDEYIGECYGLTAKIAFNKESISLPRQLAEDTKVTGWKGTGTVKLYKVNSRMAIKLKEMVKDGLDLRFTIISKLADPDAAGSERVALKNVSFDDLTLQDWEVKQPGKVESPFTFTNYEFLDSISA